ncbi:hypothetical protein BJ742DRAFT_736499 [Cladochytrium replicatum]|nr:hypothetical protein BJ742DRAFT_736499 [Cladochytrium replicatum]
MSQDTEPAPKHSKVATITPTPSPPSSFTEIRLTSTNNTSSSAIRSSAANSLHINSCPPSLHELKPLPSAPRESLLFASNASSGIAGKGSTANVEVLAEELNRRIAGIEEQISGILVARRMGSGRRNNTRAETRCECKCGGELGGPQSGRGSNANNAGTQESPRQIARKDFSVKPNTNYEVQKSRESSSSIPSAPVRTPPQTPPSSQHSFLALLKDNLDPLTTHLETIQTDLSQLQKHIHSLETTLSKRTDPLLAQIASKVDNTVLEELMRHIPTRDEVAALVEKLRGRIRVQRDEIRVLRAEQVVAATVREEESRRIDCVVRKVVEEAKGEIEGSVHRVYEEQFVGIRNGIEMLQKELLKRGGGGNSPPRNNRRSPVAPRRSPSRSTIYLDHDDLEDVVTQRQLERLKAEWDEKLHLLVCDITARKALGADVGGVQNLGTKPSRIPTPLPPFRSAQWLWNSEKLKNGSAVPWNLECFNTDPDTFIHEKDQPNLRIRRPGIYELLFSIYPPRHSLTARPPPPTLQLVIDGETVLSALHSPSYVVHHSTKTGASLVDFLSIEKEDSVLSLHVHGVGAVVGAATGPRVRGRGGVEREGGGVGSIEWGYDDGKMSTADNSPNAHNLIRCCPTPTPPLILEGHTKSWEIGGEAGTRAISHDDAV